MEIQCNGITYNYDELKNEVRLYNADEPDAAIAVAIIAHDTEQIFCDVDGIEHQLCYFDFVDAKEIARWMAEVL